MISVIKLILFCFLVCLENNFINCIRVKIPHGFDHKDTSKFHGFNAFHFDGKQLNPFDYEIDDVFHRYIKKHNRKYADHEIQHRKDNLMKSLEVIQQHIIDSINKPDAYKLGLTSLSDLSETEFKALSGTKSPNVKTDINVRSKRSYYYDNQCKPKTTDALPSAFDWRQKHAVTPIKNQGQCGSCWAHATAASIESLWAMKTGQIIDLAEQDLVNCVAANGCNGVTIPDAYNFIIKKGISQESAHPYKAKVETCNHYPVINGVQISDFCRFGGSFHWKSQYPNGTIAKEWDELDSISDERLMRSIRDNGPGIVIITTPLNFQHYVSGIFNPSDCSYNKDDTHAVQTVGWGSENGNNYWIVKNSWGAQWGESGFIRMERGRNLCGFNTWYYYPFLSNAHFINKSSDF